MKAMTDRYERIRAIASALPHPAEGEEIMVNTPYDVFTLPLQPSGLLSGPQFVVHVPGPEQPAAVDVGALRELAAKWRSMRREYDGSVDDALDNCADELESLLTAGGSDNGRRG